MMKKRTSRKGIFNSLPGERWKPINGFPLYYISSFGRIWSEKQNRRYLISHTDNCGYHHVRLYNGAKQYTRLVHRLVAEAFVENHNGYKEVNHKDEDKNNNRADNLEWCTRKYNILYGKAGKERYINMGITQRHSRNDLKPVECIDPRTGEILHRFKSIAEATRVILKNRSGSFRSTRSNIGSCCHQRKFIHTVCGYKWRFAHE